MYYLNIPGIETQRVSFYLAVEEYAARFLKEDPIFFSWQVEPSVIIGRNQDLCSEVNVDYCHKHGIGIYRRKSGGGCVYADKGNVMLAYITGKGNVMLAYSNYVNLVLSTLKRMSIQACSTGRNDIVVDGCKVSGTAFYHLPERNIVHGTLLYDTDMQNMMNSITPAKEKLVSKGVKSVRSRIGLLKDYTNLTIEEIKDKFRTLLCNKTINLSDEDLRKVREIEKSYITENFVSKQTSKWNVVRKGRVNGCGNLEVYMQVKHGNIERVELSGDYFQLKDSVGDLTDYMRGAQFTIESLKSVFLKYPPENYIRGLKGKDMIEILFD